MTNARIAETFDRIADLLEQRDESAHRVRAWRAGAQAVRAEVRELSDVFRDHGRAGLLAIPHVGPGLAGVAIELIRTGHAAALDRLRGDPIGTLARIPGLGRTLATRIHRELGIATLEDLEIAAHDGRLDRVGGFGPRRLAAVRDVLATRLGRASSPPPARAGVPSRPPPVDVLLALDARYRAEAAAGSLPRVAPHRFNPTREAWLPILHASEADWRFTVLFSNTALAHKLGRLRDWVVIYYREPGHLEGRATVVTETHGAQRGHRVVRGREVECAELATGRAA
jgi:hypothetical protein